MHIRSKAVVIGLLAAASASAQAPVPLGENWGGQLVDWTNQAVNAYGALFISDGITELAWILALVVMWIWFQWGLNRALSFAHHAHYPLPLPQVLMTFLKAACLLFLLNHYMLNFAGLAFSFHNWPMAVSKHMVLVIGNAPGNPIDHLMADLQNPDTLIDKPLSQFAIMDNIVYPLVIAWTGIVSFGMFVLGGLGFVFSGILTVLGPLLIPLWLLGGRPASWAWNWMQTMIAFASYRVIGAVIEYIMAQMWIDFITNTLAGDTSIGNWIAHGGILVFLTLFFFLAMTMVPLVAAQIFNGAGALAQAAASAVTNAATSVAKLAAAL